MNIPANLLINRFARAVTTYESQATVQRHAAERLAGMLGEHLHVLAPRMLEIGCGTGLLTRLLLQRFAPREMVLNDLCPDVGVCFANVPRVTFLPGDARELVWPGTFDAVVSASAVQWLGDLRIFAQRCAGVLPPNGLLAITGFGPETLKEIASLTGHGLTYPTFADFVAALSEAFQPLVTERDTQVLSFPDAKAVLRHLKETGVTATSAGDHSWTRSRLEAFSADYAAHFGTADGVSLTYEPYWFVGVRR